MLMLNKWWGNEIPDSAKEYRTTLLLNLIRNVTMLETGAK